MFVIDCQLLVSFVACAGISESVFPKLARQGKIAFSFSKCGERSFRDSLGGSRQHQGNRFLIQLSCADAITTLLVVDSREASGSLPKEIQSRAAKREDPLRDLSVLCRRELESLTGS